jgi:uncharacterized membrane protein
MTTNDIAPSAGDVKETSRVEAFSDGVFAIAITLLILDVRVPMGLASESNRTLAVALLRQWKDYVAYLMSFAVILVMWVNHHRIFTLVRRTDPAFLFWNGLLLMLVSIVPFPTSLLARYFAGPAARTAAAVYAGHGFLISLAFQAVWRHATRREQLLMPGTRDEVARMTARYRFGPLMYGVTLALAFVSAWVSIGLCLAFALYFSFSGLTQKSSDDEVERSETDRTVRDS